jgi:tetratricopeptide (TPR) repeat protein
MRFAWPAAFAALTAMTWLVSRPAAGVVGGVSVGLLVGFGVVLPRVAHRAFERGDEARAELLYRVVRAVTTGASARGAIDVSVAGCRLGRGDAAAALAVLDRVNPDTLGVAARAAWLNNRAYALARDGKGTNDDVVHHALSSIDAAVKLRPDVAGFRHTRGVVLLALGRLDDAIAELDDVWQRHGGDEAPPLLEAERCYDLGVAWTRKGEADYARDYFQRAQRVAPRSPWAARASAALA